MWKHVPCTACWVEEQSRVLDLIAGHAMKMLGVLEDLHLMLKKHVSLASVWALG